MSKLKNIATVAKLSEKFSRAKSFVLTDYRGLTHKQLEDLRAKLRPLNADYTIAKKTLLKIAGLPREALNEAGPLSILFIYRDPFAPLKELAKFIKLTNLPQIKMSLIDNVEYSAGQTLALAKLPDLQTLRAQLASVLNANIQKLAYILEEVRKLER